MFISNYFVLLILVGGLIRAEDELVWLDDVNYHERRHLDSELPENLEFNLNRHTGSDVKLSLRENRRLNANAHVFETMYEDGIMRVARKNRVSRLTTKFYHDKRTGAAVKVSCNKQTSGPCQITLEGSLSIGDESYDILPHPLIKFTRTRTLSTKSPHILRKVPNVRSTNTDERTYGSFMADYKTSDNEDTRSYSSEEISGQSRDKNVLRSLLDLKNLDDTLDKLLSLRGRRKKTSTEFAVEILVVVDPLLWAQYHDSSSDEETTEYTIRELLAQIVNGVSLRFESIEDTELNMYVTISGFLFCKTELASSNVTTWEYEGEAKANAIADEYLDDLVGWAQQLTDLPQNDHIMVFTGYELWSEDFDPYLAGMAFLGRACEAERISIQEVAGFFTTTSIAAHELGHNLNSIHDGNDTSIECPEDDQYIMAPSTTVFDTTSDYSVNPWRFSSCSIAAFKSFIGDGLCFVDNADIYNETEWNLHKNNEPGEIYSLDEQCKMIRGTGSGHCRFQDKEEEILCRYLLCADENDVEEGGCYIYAAARGSPCGAESDNKWCIDGACVVKT